MGHTILPCLSQHFLLQNEKFELDESFSEMVLDGQKSHSCFRVLCYWVSFPWWMALMSVEVCQPIIPHAALRPGEIMISSLPWQLCGVWVEGQLQKCLGAREYTGRKCLSPQKFSVWGPEALPASPLSWPPPQTCRIRTCGVGAASGFSQLLGDADAHESLRALNQMISKPLSKTKMLWWCNKFGTVL